MFWLEYIKAKAIILATELLKLIQLKIHYLKLAPVQGECIPKCLLANQKGGFYTAMEWPSHIWLLPSRVEYAWRLVPSENPTTKHRSFFDRCVCVCVHVTCLHMSVPGVPFLRSHPPWFLRQGLSLSWSSTRRLHRLLAIPRGALSPFPLCWIVPCSALDVVSCVYATYMHACFVCAWVNMHSIYIPAHVKAQSWPLQLSSIYWGRVFHWNYSSLIPACLVSQDPWFHVPSVGVAKSPYACLDFTQC